MNISKNISKLAFLFIVFAVVAGGSVTHVLSCQFQSILETSFVIKHVFGVLLIFLFIMLEGGWDFSKKGGINYSKNCCFFSIPMNTHANTFSTGTPMITMGASIPTMKARTNISASQRQQMIDKRVRRLLK